MSEDIDITIEYQKVTDLMRNYRDTLITLAGSFGKIDIPWNDTEEYEYWEDIASSIYDGVVTYTLEKYFSDGQNFDQRMTKYAFYYKDYSNKSFLKVAGKDKEDFDHLVFICFKTKDKPFDTVVCNKINSYGKINEEGIEFPFEEAKFLYVHREFTGVLISHTELK